MKIRSLSLVIAILIVFLFAIGCSSQESTINVSIVSDKESYSPTMSSVPGLPLIASVSSSVELSNLEYTWKTDKGSFITWGEDTGYAVKKLGQECTIKNNDIYWAPISESNPNNESIKVSVVVRQSGSERIIGQKSILIKSSEDHLFSIQK
jgi:hypothetical protein